MRIRDCFCRCLSQPQCSTPAAAQSFAAAFPARILAAHNAERARAGVPPLTWDNALGTAAAAYAQQMAIPAASLIPTALRAREQARICGWARMGHSASKRWSAAGHPRSAISMPVRFPNISRTGDWEDVGHYTQMIWPTTRASAARSPRPRASIISSAATPTTGNIDGRPVGYRHTLGQRRSPGTRTTFAVTALRRETCEATLVLQAKCRS